MLKNRNLLLLLAGLLTGLCFGCTPSESAVQKPPRGYINESWLKAAYVTGLLKLIEDSPEVPAHLTVHKDLVYKETPQKTLKLDLYQPQNAQKKTPLLIFIHGGSWKSGNKDDYRRYLVDYAEKGYITATVAYRFSQEKPFPAAFDDVVCAVQWLKSNADQYHIDPEKIAVIGGSAGGHLAMMLAYHARDSTYAGDCVGEIDAEIQAVVNLYGPVDLTTDFAINHPSVKKFLGKDYSEATSQLYEAASPINFISPDDPPTLTFHGTIDQIVPVSQADLLHETLQLKQVPSEYHRLKGWPHTMDLGLKVNRYCQFHMDAFFQKHLR